MPDLPDNRHDRFHDTLTALRTDTDRRPLHPVADVRRRGDRRTRNQAVAAGVAAVTALVLAAGSFGGLVGEDRAVAPPATQAPSPTAPSEAPPLGLSADPFLTDQDLAAVGTYTDFAGHDVEPNHLMRCLPSPLALGGTEARSRTYGQETGEASINEYVVRFAIGEQAAAALRRLQTEFESCPEGNDPTFDVLDRGPSAVPVGDEAFSASRNTVPNELNLGAEPSYYEVGVAREANVLVVLEWSAFDSPVADGRIVWNEQRLETALHRAVDRAG